MDTTTLQLRLLQAGHEPGAIDGRLGPKTRRALKAFQQEHGLTSDGEVDLGTFAKLPELGRPAVLGTDSERVLAQVHSDLRAVVRRALDNSDVAFIVTEGARSLARQKHLVAAGASRTLRSRHLSGHAVDLAVRVAGQIRWDWLLYERLALSMKAAAADLRVPLEWGGDWRGFRDGPHFQLPWSSYPSREPRRSQAARPESLIFGSDEGC